MLFENERVRFVPRGKSTSRVEVTNVSSKGFWLMISGREAFLSFEQFPWFRDASIGALLDVRLPHPGHLYWPQLDIDLAVESIDSPDRFPLVSRAARAKAKGRTVTTSSR